ncbi:MAG: penicillin-binding protein 2 [Oligoflexales bacterium]
MNIGDSHHSSNSPLIEGRFFLASFFCLLVVSGLILRLWFVQVYKGEQYQRISETNRVRRVEIPAPRGMVYDRNGEVILGNRPFFELVYIPQYVKKTEETLKALSQLLHVPMSSFRRMVVAGHGRPEFLPITLKRNLSIHEVSLIESNKFLLPGVEVNIVPRRDYHPYAPPHMIGYLGEVSRKDLDRSEDLKLKDPYRPGDLIGKQGLESTWEHYLRGKRGTQLVQVDAFGRQTNSVPAFFNLPEEPATPGADLTLTLDLRLQKTVLTAFQGKYGAVVAIDPQNGEILAMLSSPSFDPTMYQDSLSIDKWNSLLADPFKPLFDKTTGGEFPPGSIYKPIVALAALEEGIITDKTNFHCNGSFTLGRDKFHCHRRSGHGVTNLLKAMRGSCDVFFYHIGVELGMDRIAQYARGFGLGERLGIQLNNERPGLIPDSQSKRVRVAIGETPNLAIGQGSNLLTPLQMANLYAALGNGGKVWKPTLLKHAHDHVGQTLLEHKPELLTQLSVKPKHMRLIQQSLEEVISHPRGTGRRAALDHIKIAGKTGSVQVVNLKKTRHRTEKISMKWQEHAVFAGYAPAENPQIALIVISENDPKGGGGKVAAPIAKEIFKGFFALPQKNPQGLHANTHPHIHSKRL